MNRDLGVTEAIRSLLPESAVPLFEAVAMLGDLVLVVAVLAGLALVDAYRSLRRGADGPLSERTAFLLAVVLGGLALTLVLKTAIGASRPPDELQAVAREGEGFPSGHTMAATVLWGSLALWSERRTKRMRLLGASGIVGLVGLSRLALGVHFLVDVLASIAFGLGYLAIAAWVLAGDPRRAFAGAAALGAAALIVTGASADGLLAFVGCVGGAMGWWILGRVKVQALWASVAT
ncbi:phosphatase PAP2 family protein [Halovivax sp.]|uniref:phosphatase PAP2 family protein n=1 Tax=Halovivax sp. TaxID=1935978 RepID=UPI0025C3AC18|nr:phosphatase PAP2 family protein [Halovivax sp.]